ncbi:MAG: DUF4129 domain-containing protein [Myxococcaceae bacterium]|nr:DUF4129 domain-containing protein [Myxococcaceae bacterium]
MTALALALVLGAAPCELPLTPELTEQQAVALCSLPKESPAGAGRSALAAIYERRGFEQARAPQPGDTLKRLRAWLESIFETAGAETYSNLTRVVVLVAAALGAIALVVRIAGRRRTAPKAAVAATTAPGLLLADPVEHLTRARALLTTEPRSAAREGLLALLSALERRRFARPDRVKTNREIVSELPSRGAPPALVDAVRTHLGWFDRAWYSVSPLEASAAGRFLDEVQTLVTQLAEPRP